MACSETVQTPCGTRCRQYKLICRDLLAEAPCGDFEGVAVTVTYDAQAQKWSYVDPDGCESHASSESLRSITAPSARPIEAILSTAPQSRREAPE